MFRKILISFSIGLTFLTAFAFLTKPAKQQSIVQQITYGRVKTMPIVTDDPWSYLAYGGVPQEQRGEKYKKWLAAGVKISVSGGSGSGTIVYYSPDGWAYVQSCGHLWENGTMTVEEGKQRKLTCKVTTWYHNEKKLPEPKTYTAEVIYYSHVRTKDCSLLRFRPDWEPLYFPIAPEDYVYETNSRLHSIGCDSGKEIAHYDIRVIGINQNKDLVTTENSPRPGRSGGGLLTDAYYVGICWGTEFISGEGNGFFTPLQTVRELNAANGYDWLNNVSGGLAQRIPIVDRNNPQQKYPRDYIPVPGSRKP